MSALFAAIRAVHYASAMLLMGELVFALLLAGPVLRGAQAIDGADPGSGEGDRARRRLLRIARWSVVACLASAAAWLAMTAVIMSGLPIQAALGRHNLEQVLGSTMFCRVFILRLGILGVLWAMLSAFARALRETPRTRLAAGMLGLAAAYLAGLAWSGHAAAVADGPMRDAAIASDVVHLLAGGAWLGSLPALVLLLGRVRAPTVVARIVRRFSALGLLCVALVTASGLANAWNLVGGVPGLVGTGYGQLLLCKIVLFGAMLVLAAANRWRHAPRLLEGGRVASGKLRRNAMLEIGAGGGVLMLVGFLGVTVPGAHQSPRWPFDHTLSLASLAQSVPLRMAAVAAGVIACVGAAALFAGFIRHRARLWLPGLVGVLAPIALIAALLAVPAHPTTYAISPIGFTTAAIDRGATIYASNCAACHGPSGRGDGAAGRALPIHPADLTEHASRHAAGDLFWWIAHGVPGTPMPAFTPALGESDIWHVIQFLRILADASEASASAQEEQALPPIAAPDFTFELPGRAQESLRDLLASGAVLLVLYTLPESLPRLSELGLADPAYASEHARIVALPLRGTPLADAGPVANAGAFVARASASVAAVYTMFARAEANPPDHLEFLIDREGDLRFRWIGVAAVRGKGGGGALDRIEALNHEVLRPSRPAAHHL